MDRVCVCRPGWATANCSVACPGGSASPCSGHGVCNDTRRRRDVRVPHWLEGAGLWSALPWDTGPAGVQWPKVVQNLEKNFLSKNVMRPIKLISEMC